MTHTIPHNAVWLAFDNKTPLEEAYNRFREKYGKYPNEHWYVPPGLLYVGPVEHGADRNAYGETGE